MAAKFRGKSNAAEVVRRDKSVLFSGRQPHPGTGSFHPVTTEAVVEVTKPLEPSV
jgi:hypothetical protein